LPDNGNMRANDHRPPLTWDLFCHVIDNWGDLGVCWRLASGLRQAGQRVRLWVDEPAPLAWMAPEAGTGHDPALQVHPWPRGAPPPLDLPPGDVLVEAFGCEVDPAWVQVLQPQAAGRLWLNLEYLSAEPYVARCHGLPSPVLTGPLQGRTKWFFYPGFTPLSGGLLRETALLAQQQAFDASAWWRGQGSAPPAGPVVSLFCYEPPALPALLQAPALAQATWVLSAGRGAAAFDAARPHLPATASVLALPPTPQADFDQRLWVSDFNLVRGEDSLVRALWAGEALLWQLYPQHDGAHAAKLEAFLDWLQAPPGLRRLHRLWNGTEAGTLPPLDLPAWRDCVQGARQRLLAQPDLVTQLLRFAAEKR
jgi:uncharacterized repeat protein (TIGR03837 family)